MKEAFRIKSFNKLSKKANIIFNNKYKYDIESFINVKSKTKILCPTHGIFLISFDKHIHKSQECPICTRERFLKKCTHTFDSFLIRANKIHNDKYSYIESSFKGIKYKTSIICPIHGIFNQIANEHLRGYGCSICSSIKIGINNRMNFDDFLLKANIVHNNKYEYIKDTYTKASDKINIICPVHGEFIQTGSEHLYGHGCPTCGKDKGGESRKISFEDFILQAEKIHGKKFLYNKNSFIKRCDEIEIICPIHGKFYQNGNNHLQGSGCQKCSCTQSKQETKIQDLLKKYNVLFIERDRSQIKPLELDIFIPSKNLAVELNGTYWHSEEKGKDKDYHLNKLKLCKEKNINLIQIFDYELLYKTKIVLSRLKNILGLTKYSIFARKCEIREIDTQIKNKFLNKYHLQGEDKSSIKLGLFYKNRLVEVMTFCKKRLALGNKIKDNNSWELIRFCGTFNFNVVGGAGKLLKYFERKYKPESIISYADLRWSNGNLYLKLGFNLDHISKPNYWYFNKNNIKKIYHRFNFRKQELPKKLKVFDINLTEWENMKSNGWNRFWDCGNLMFKKN